MILRQVLQRQRPLQPPLHDGGDDFLKIENPLRVAQRQVLLFPLCSAIGQVEAVDTVAILPDVGQHLGLGFMQVGHVVAGGVVLLSTAEGPMPSMPDRNRRRPLNVSQHSVTPAWASSGSTDAVIFPSTSSSRALVGWTTMSEQSSPWAIRMVLRNTLMNVSNSVMRAWAMCTEVTRRGSQEKGASTFSIVTLCRNSSGR